MKIAYFDCFSGISGDMVLGAFVDCGVSLSRLKKELAKLKVKGFELKAAKVKRGHLAATKVEVIIKKNFRLANLEEIKRVLKKSSLPAGQKEKINAAFENLARAESRVHKKDINSVHFHQLGDLDTLVDICGCVIAADLLGIEKIYASALSLGKGQVKFGKEYFPLPAPATLELLRGRNVTIDPAINYDNITPPGAVILKTFSEEFPKKMTLKVLSAGYGAGTYQAPGLPNVLRVMIAQTASDDAGADRIKVVETNVDDTLPLNFEALYERLFAAGALDVFTQSILMKKMRPAQMISVQTEEKFLDAVVKVLFEETATIGVRVQDVCRRKLDRKILNLKSDYGIIVRVKIAFYNGEKVNIMPEYEDCRKIAKLKKLPFKQVYERIKAQAIEKFA